MVDIELLQAIGAMMDSKLEPIQKQLDTMDGRLDAMDGRLDAMDGRFDIMESRLDTIEGRLEKLEEDSAVTRSGVNTLLDWAEQAQVEVKIPLYKKAE